MEESKYEMYYPQTSISNPAELGRLPVNWRRRKERDKVSEVWKTFYVSPVEPNAVVCRLCFITLSYVGGSTSGMRNHLQNKHRHIIPKAFSSAPSSSNTDSSNRRSREQISNPPSSSRLSSESLPVPLTSPLPIQVNHSSSNCFPASSQNNSSSSPTCLSPPSPYTERNGDNNPGLVSSRRAREVAVMCASDLISPTVVSGKGFHRMFRLLSGDSQALDLTNVSAQTVRSAMKDLQFSLRLKIQRQMSSSSRIPNGDYKKDAAPKRRPVSLILCPWTYINPPSNNEFWDFDCNSPVIQCTRFLDVRAQFFGDDWQPESRLLGTLPLPVTHNEMLTQELESSSEKLTVALRHLISTTYELTDSQIVACVFPKCPVLDACVASLKWSPVPCVAHMLDSVVERAFDSSPVVIPSTNHETKRGASALRTKCHGIGDLLDIGIELWKNQKKPKSGKFGNGDPCHDVDLSGGVGNLLENAHQLSDDELKSSLYRQKRGRWRIWCHLLERLLALTEMEIKDSRFSDWKRNLLSLMPTVTRLGTAWEALSCGSSGANDDIPLLSCALPILCSLPFCPSPEDSGSGDNVEETHSSAADKPVIGSEEHPVRSSRSAEAHRDDCLELECVGSAVRHKLKVSLDIAVNIARSDELKGSALLMALSAFVDPRHKALLFLSATQREEVQQEALRLMSAEECLEKSEAKSVRDSPKTGEKRSSSIGNSPYHKRSKLEDLLHGVFGYSTALDFTDISHEIEHYIGEPIAPLSQIPSVWWRQRESKYPRLSQMARRLLTIPASVSTGRRGMSTLHLSPEDITVVLFLHSNLTPSDLEEMGFEVEDEGWRQKHDRAEEDEGERDDDLREESSRVEDYDETARVVDEDHFYEIESEIHVIKKEPELMNE